MRLRDGEIKWASARRKIVRTAHATPHIGSHNPADPEINPLTDENAALLDELRSILATSADEPELSLTRIEDLLTAGYANALALEAERWRFERRLEELAAGLSESDDSAGVHEELTEMARRIAVTDADLGLLRDQLETVRRRASELRAAAVPA
jgi:hypothetical protein